MGKPKEWMLNETGRMNTEELWLILVETQVTSYRAGLASHSLNGVWQWRLGRFLSAVIGAGMQAPQPQLPNWALASFSVDLKHFDRDIYKKQQLTLRKKLVSRERCYSPQTKITPAVHLPLSFCQHGDLGNRFMVWYTKLASCRTLDETVARCNKKCNNCAVTAPDRITLLLISHAGPLRWRVLSSTKPTSRLPAAFSSCRHLGRHLLGFQLCLSLMLQSTSPLSRKS